MTQDKKQIKRRAKREKDGRGGARPGAGRPRGRKNKKIKKIKKMAIHCRISPEAWEKLQKIPGRTGQKIEQLLEKLAFFEQIGEMSHDKILEKLLEDYKRKFYEAPPEGR